MKKIFNFEREASQYFHKDKKAVLISSAFLRKYGCGQVDVSYWDQNILHLVEVKSSKTGIEAIKRGQQQRLVRSVTILRSLLNVEVKLKYIYKR